MRVASFSVAVMLLAFNVSALSYAWPTPTNISVDSEANDETFPFSFAAAPGGQTLTNNNITTGDQIGPEEGGVKGAILGTVQTRIASSQNLISDFGAKGDGVTNDDIPWRKALSSVANGGRLVLPCGVYRLTPFSFNVAAYKELIIQGSGACSELYFPSLTGTAIRINLNQQFAAFHIRDLAITTDTASDSSFGVAVFGPTGVLSAGDSAYNDFTNVIFRAHTGNFQTGYFGVAVYANLVNNITFDKTQFWGPSGDGSSRNPYKGVAVKFEGAPTGCTQKIGGATTNFCYVVGFKFINSYMTQCATCVIVGNYAQDVSFTQTDIQGANIGISVPKGQTANDGLEIINSQLFARQAAVANYSAISFSFIGSSCQIIAENSSCLNIGAKLFSVIGSHFNGVDTGTSTPVPGSTGIIAGSGATKGVISGNTYSFIAVGNYLPAGSSFVNVQANSYSSVTTHNVDAGKNNSIGVTTD